MSDKTPAQQVAEMVGKMQQDHAKRMAIDMAMAISITVRREEENKALGRRAVACKHWRWMPGMLTTDGARISEVDPDDGTAYFREVVIGACPIDADAMPDITDPATLGCLEYLIREAWGPDYIICAPEWDSEHIGDYAEALVAALEAAP